MPFLSALEVVTTTRYTNRRLFYFTNNVVEWIDVQLLASIGAPTNVQLRRTSSTALIVSWDPPPSSPAGSVTGYRVYYSSYADHDLERWLSVEIGPYTVTELSGLQTHTVYAVRVRAKATDGQLGALSDVVVSNKLEHGQPPNDTFGFRL